GVSGGVVWQFCVSAGSAAGFVSQLTTRAYRSEPTNNSGVRPAQRCVTLLPKGLRVVGRQDSGASPGEPVSQLGPGCCVQTAGDVSGACVANRGAIPFGRLPVLTTQPEPPSC